MPGASVRHALPPAVADDGTSPAHCSLLPPPSTTHCSFVVMSKILMHVCFCPRLLSFHRCNDKVVCALAQQQLTLRHYDPFLPSQSELMNQNLLLFAHSCHLYLLAAAEARRALVSPVLCLFPRIAKAPPPLGSPHTPIFTCNALLFILHESQHCHVYNALQFETCSDHNHGPPQVPALVWGSAGALGGGVIK